MTPAADRSHLEGVEAGDDTSVLHLAALGWMGELTLLVGARARAPLELPAHLQREPLGVSHVGHVHRHGGRMIIRGDVGCERLRVCGDGIVHHTLQFGLTPSVCYAQR